MSIFGDINTVELLGNVTQDPEVRSTQSGVKVASISMATNSSYKKDDEWKTDVEFHNIVLWNRLAEHAETRLQKGSRILIKGKLTTRSWEHEGKKYYKTEIVASEMILIDRYLTKDGNQVNKRDSGNTDNTEMVENTMGDMTSEASIDPDDLPF